MPGRNKDVAAIMKTLMRPENGCKVSVTAGGHWKVVRAGCQPVFIASSPSDPHAVRNIKADVRRLLGIQL